MPKLTVLHEQIGTIALAQESPLAQGPAIIIGVNGVKIGTIIR